MLQYTWLWIYAELSHCLTQDLHSTTNATQITQNYAKSPVFIMFWLNTALGHLQRSHAELTIHWWLFYVRSFKSLIKVFLPRWSYELKEKGLVYAEVQKETNEGILVLKLVTQQNWCVSQEGIQEGYQEDNSELLPEKFPLSDMELPVITINLTKSASAKQSQVRNGFLSRHYLASDWCRFLLA